MNITIRIEVMNIAENTFYRNVYFNLAHYTSTVHPFQLSTFRQKSIVLRIYLYL